MKQEHFFKDAYELQRGDRIFVSGNDFDPPLTGEQYEVTIFAIRKEEKLSFCLFCNLEGQQRWTRNVEFDHRFELVSIKHQRYLWVRMSNFEIGDVLGNVGPIERIIRKGNFIFLEIKRFSDGESEVIKYSADTYMHYRQY